MFCLHFQSSWFFDRGKLVYKNRVRFTNYIHVFPDKKYTLSNVLFEISQIPYVSDINSRFFLVIATVSSRSASCWIFKYQDFIQWIISIFYLYFIKYISRGLDFPKICLANIFSEKTWYTNCIFHNFRI